jgi:phosphohistidine phosphatase
MKLYLLRHASAVDVGDQGVERDEDRMLTGEGRARTRSVAEGLRACGCAPRRIVASPLVRARETADIAAAILTPGATIETSAELAPGMSPARTASWLRRGPRLPTMLVGHMPGLQQLASYLLSGAESVDIGFKKLGCCCLLFEAAPVAGGGCLKWCLPPKISRSLPGKG